MIAMPGLYGSGIGRSTPGVRICLIDAADKTAEKLAGGPGALGASASQVVVDTSKRFVALVVHRLILCFLRRWEERLLKLSGEDRRA